MNDEMVQLRRRFKQGKKEKCPALLVQWCDWTKDINGAKKSKIQAKLPVSSAVVQLGRYYEQGREPCPTVAVVQLDRA